MEIKHTIGPWRSVKDNAGTHVNGANSLVVCHLKNCDKENRENNANLIAAAPCLLAALQEIASHSYDKWSEGCIAQEIAIAAIAKVTGGAA